MESELEQLKLVYNMRKEKKKIFFENEMIQTASKGMVNECDKPKKCYSYYTIKLDQDYCSNNNMNMSDNNRESNVREPPLIKKSPLDLIVNNGNDKNHSNNYKKKKRVLRDEPNQAHILRGKLKARQLNKFKYYNQFNITNELKGIQPKTPTNKLIKLHHSNQFFINPKQVNTIIKLPSSFSQSKLDNIKLHHNRSNNNAHNNNNGIKAKSLYSNLLFNNKNKTILKSNTPTQRSSSIKTIDLETYTDNTNLNMNINNSKAYYRLGNKSTCSSYKFYPLFCLE